MTKYESMLLMAIGVWLTGSACALVLCYVLERRRRQPAPEPGVPPGDRPVLLVVPGGGGAKPQRVAAARRPQLRLVAAAGHVPPRPDRVA